MHRGGRWVFELGIYAQPCEQLLFQATSTAPTIATAAASAAFNPFQLFYAYKAISIMSAYFRIAQKV